LGEKIMSQGPKPKNPYLTSWDEVKKKKSTSPQTNKPSEYKKVLIYNTDGTVKGVALEHPENGVLPVYEEKNPIVKHEKTGNYVSLTPETSAQWQNNPSETQKFLDENSSGSQNISTQEPVNPYSKMIDNAYNDMQNQLDYQVKTAVENSTNENEKSTLEKVRETITVPMKKIKDGMMNIYKSPVNASLDLLNGVIGVSMSPIGTADILARQVPVIGEPTADIVMSPFKLVDQVYTTLQYGVDKGLQAITGHKVERNETYQKLDELLKSLSQFVVGGKILHMGAKEMVPNEIMKNDNLQRIDFTQEQVDAWKKTLSEQDKIIADKMIESLQDVNKPAAVKYLELDNEDLKKELQTANTEKAGEILKNIKENEKKIEEINKITQDSEVRSQKSVEEQKTGAENNGTQTPVKIDSKASNSPVETKKPKEPIVEPPSQSTNDKFWNNNFEKDVKNKVKKIISEVENSSQKLKIKINNKEFDLTDFNDRKKISKIHDDLGKQEEKLNKEKEKMLEGGMNAYVMARPQYKSLQKRIKTVQDKIKIIQEGADKYKKLVEDNQKIIDEKINSLKDNTEILDTEQKTSDFAGEISKSNTEVPTEVKSKLSDALDRFGLKAPSEEEFNMAVTNVKKKLSSQKGLLVPLPTAIPELITIAKYKIAQGLKKFPEWRVEMIKSVGDRVRPLLKKVWEEVKAFATGEKALVDMNTLGAFGFKKFKERKQTEFNDKFNNVKTVKSKDILPEYSIYKATDGFFIEKDNQLVWDEKKHKAKLFDTRQEAEQYLKDLGVSESRETSNVNREMKKPENKGKEQFYKEGKKDKLADSQKIFESMKGKKEFNPEEISKQSGADIGKVNAAIDFYKGREYIEEKDGKLIPTEKFTKLLESRDKSAVNSLLSKVPLVGKFVDMSVLPTGKKLALGTGKTIKGIVNFLSPRSFVDQKGQDLLQRTLGSRNKVEAFIDNLFDEYEKGFGKMNQAEQIDFVDKIKKGEKQANPQLQECADLMKTLEESYKSELMKYKPSLNWLENHYRVMWKTIPGDIDAGKGFKGIFRKPLQGTKGFMKPHTLETMSEGFLLGGEPYSYNPITNFKKAYMDVQKYITAQRMWEGFGNLDLRKFVIKGGNVPEGMVKLDDKIAKVYFPNKEIMSKREARILKEDLIKTDLGIDFNDVKDDFKDILEREPKTKGFIEGGEWYVDEGVGRMLNNYLSKDYIRGSDLGRGIMWIKNSTTAIELGLSPFHAVFESIETIGSTIGLGIQKIVNRGIRGDWINLKSGFSDIGSVIFSPSEFGRGFKELKSTKNIKDFGRSVLHLSTSIGSTGKISTIGGDAMRLATKKGFLESDYGKKFLEEFPNARELLDAGFTGGLKFKQHPEFVNSSVQAFKENWANDNYIGSTLRLMPAINEMVMHPLFEVYIPRLKWGMFFKEYSYELKEQAKRIEQGKVTKEQLAREIVDSIENRFGEMNFDNLWWNRTFKTAMQLMFRSITWKLGNIREFGNAFRGQGMEIINAIKEKRAPLMHRDMGWLLGMSVSTAALSYTIQKLFTGKNPESIKDLVFPRIDDKGNRVSTPTYWRDVLSLIKSPSLYVQHSMSGFIGRMAEIWNNKDFYNTEIYDPNDNVFEITKDMFVHAVPLPFGVSSYLQSVKEGMNTSRKITGFFGLTKASKYIENTRMQNRISDLYQDRFSGGKISKDEKSQNDARFEIRKLLQESRFDEASDRIIKALDEGELSEKQIQQLESGYNVEKDIKMFKRFNAVDQKELIKKMSLSELERYIPEAKLPAVTELEKLNPEGKKYLDNNPNIKFNIEYKQINNDMQEIEMKFEKTKDEQKKQEYRTEYQRLYKQLQEMKENPIHKNRQKELNEKKKDNQKVKDELIGDQKKQSNPFKKKKYKLSELIKQ
jgi:hypothetical protein